MGLFITLLIILFIWIGYAGWSAPLMRETEDGTWITIRPEKKFSDLFKKKQFEIDLNDQRLGMDFVKPKRKYIKKKK